MFEISEAAVEAVAVGVVAVVWWWQKQWGRECLWVRV